MKTLFLYFTTFIVLLLVACEAEPDNGGPNPPEPKAKVTTWIVTASISGDDFLYGPFKIKTQTTTDNDSLSIKDDGGFWNFQVRAAFNSTSNTFTSNSSVNSISTVGSKIKVLNGTIGSDNISFNIQFEDDETPYGITYNITGERE